MTDNQMLKAFLEASEADWDDLQKKGLVGSLTSIVPLVVSYQDDLEDAKKFFVKVKELTFVKQIDEQLNSIDHIRQGITDLVQEPTLDPDEVKQLLTEAMTSLKQAYTRYAELETKTVEIIRSGVKGKPKEAFLDKIRSYWNYIDNFWGSKREILLNEWDEYFDATRYFLDSARESVAPQTLAPHSTLVKVEALLKKRLAPLLAQKVSDSLERIKNFYVEEYGLIPAYMGAQGNWKVEADDCPEKRLPEKHTKLTDRFAFCRFEGKNCPSFAWSQGSYVKCKSFVRLKEANFISDINTLNDKDLLKLITEIGETDPFVKMLLIESQRRDGNLFEGKVIDKQLETMLEQYPSSNRRGRFDYRVFMVANDPVLVSGDKVIAADRILLETLGEGERMPKYASVQKIAGPVVRITFTANALRDPEFRDFLRKKKAVKCRMSTYDIPFDKEEDIAFLLAEIKDEFGYKIEIFSILEDTDRLLEKDFGVRRYSDLPIFKYSALRLALAYIPPIKASREEVQNNSVSLSGAEKLVTIANTLPKGALKDRLADIADRLRVSNHIVIATKDEVIHYEDGGVGIAPEPGIQFTIKDPDTGENALVELVEADTYKVRRLDSGKEIELNDPWSSAVTACGMDPLPPPPPFGGGMFPPPPPVEPNIAPPMGFIISEDGIHYLVQRLDSPPMGQFPGEPPPPPFNEGVIAPPPAPLPPIMNTPPPLPPPPVMAPEAPVIQTGPTVEQKDVFIPKDVDAEADIIEDIRSKVKPGLKFNNMPISKAPSATSESEVSAAMDKLKSMFKGDPRIKDVRQDLSPRGKTVLYVHSTMPKSMKDEIPSSVDGFEVIVAPEHDTRKKPKGEDTTADSLVDSMPNRPENGKSSGREYPPGPYPDQVSGSPTVGDMLVTQVRDTKIK